MTIPWGHIGESIFKALIVAFHRGTAIYGMDAYANISICSETPYEK